jgi:prepilin-type N-terminal cleavage/methylation domain-containing protein/prepilin-type processing-associated H-X9-DG protein
MKLKRNEAFTLVELLVVIAIIGILVALLLPAVQAAREAARRMSCTNNLTQLAIAVQGYESAFRVYPPGTIDESGPIVNVAQGYHHNWLGKLLPYMEEQNTYQHIDFSVGVYDEKNKPVREVAISLHFCPSDPYANGEKNATSYAGLHHDLNQPIDTTNNGVFFLNTALDYEQISDGSSQTIFIGEKFADRQRDLGWMSGTRATLRNTGTPLNAGKQKNWGGSPPETEDVSDPLAVGGFGSYHPGGGNFAFGDGHVGYLSQNLDVLTYQQLGHRADGKLLTRAY